MMDAYKSRGFFCFVMTLWSLLRGLYELLFGAVDARLLGLVCISHLVAVLFWALLCWRARRLTRAQWEEKHGIFDERENAVRGYAARVTLRIMAAALYIAAGLVPAAAGWALLGVLVVGGIVYYVAQYFVGERM